MATEGALIEGFRGVSRIDGPVSIELSVDWSTPRGGLKDAFPLVTGKFVERLDI